jgi:glyoxylase-like metal-dependent hydrolase (beta-lactamase superfamily II)
MIDQTVVIGPFQCNCRLLACPETGEGLLVDPGDEPEKILRAVAAARTPSGQPVRIRYLLHTHAHLDHIGGTRGVAETLRAGIGPRGSAEAPVSIALHREDEPLYRALKMQGQLFGIDYDEPLPIDQFLSDGEELRVGKLKLGVVHTPGHSPGSICLRLHEDSAARARETLFTGDTLFLESVGRTDLWGGDQDVLFRSIRERIFRLDDDTRVCPGHGPDSTVGHEKRENPFL